jgi:putative methionine-R-sulfoxide reductase with GAF domain
MAVHQDPSLADSLTASGGATPQIGAPLGGHSGERISRAGLDSALQQIAEQSQVMTHAGGAAVALRAGEQMVCRARAGTMAPPLGAPINITTGLTGECVRTGRVLVCEDTDTDSRVDHEVCRSLGIRSLVVMPIFVESELLAVFEVFSPRPNVFNQPELEALEIMRELVVSVLRPEPAVAAPVSSTAETGQAVALARTLLGDDVESPAFCNPDPEDDLVCEVEARDTSLAALNPVENGRAADIPQLRISPKLMLAGVATVLAVLLWLNWCTHASPRAAPRQSVPAASTRSPAAPPDQTAAAPPSPASAAAPPAKLPGQPGRADQPNQAKPATLKQAGAPARKRTLAPPPLPDIPINAAAGSDIVPSLAEAQPSVLDPQPTPPPADAAAPAPAASAEPDEAAISVLQRAAAQGRAQAQLDLAVHYANGEGVPQSYPDALHWFSLAQGQGVLPRDPAAVDARERTEAWVLEHMRGPR